MIFGFCEITRGERHKIYRERRFISGKVKMKEKPGEKIVRC